MSVFVAEVARPTLVFRGLLGQTEPIPITGGRAVADYREAFVGIDVAKLKNAIAVADSGREGEIRFWGEVDASDVSMRRIIQRHRKLHRKEARLCRRPILLVMPGRFSPTGS